MPTDWDLVSRLGVPIFTAGLGALINHILERRAKLIVYYGHVSAFKVRNGDEPPIDVHTHSVVIKNTGRKTSMNIRLSHEHFPENVYVYPQIQYRIESLNDGHKELVIPTLVPHEQVTVSYLYYPPFTYNRINNVVRSDEGIAKYVPTTLSRQYSPWVVRFALVLMGAGGIALLYALIEFVLWMIRAR